MEKILNRSGKTTNVKPDCWYKNFYGDWIMNFYIGLTPVKECIEYQKEFDKCIDKNQLEKPKKFKYDCKDFITENNSYEKNRELLIEYEQLQLEIEIEGEPRDLELQQLFNKCFLVLEQGFLITNQLFIFYKWFDESEEYNYYD
ncbi:MAG: hypothetical protein ACFFDF_14210 [Candidatus Odinarchaeota archaeon]